jgi:hypothetical protein
MNNEQPIDLSRAYVGQTVIFRNKQNAVIDTIYLSDFTDYYTIHSVCGNYHTLHRKDGTDLDNETQWDIIELKDPIQVQVARIEGMIEAYDKINGMIKHEFMREFLTEKNELRKQLKALTDANN